MSKRKRNDAPRMSSTAPPGDDPASLVEGALALAAASPEVGLGSLSTATLPVAFDGEKVYTLEELVARYGPATVDDILAYLEGATNEALVADGADVATERINRDAPRLYGIATDFFTIATPEQLDFIPGVTEDFLRAAIWSAYQGYLVWTSMQVAGTRVKVARSGRTASSKDIQQRGSARRDVLDSGLRFLIGEKNELRGRLDVAYRSSNQPFDVATTIRALAEIGRLVLADTSPGAVQRRRGSRITAAFLAGSEALAADVEASGREAGAVPARLPVSQTDLDLWDGRNLLFMGKLIDAFESGHAAEPSVPRLIPNSLRSWFGRRRSERKVDTGTSTPPTPSTPPKNSCPTPPANSSSTVQA